MIAATKNIRIATIGGVIGPGATARGIVPLSERISIEARVQPASIGFVRVGQQVQVKLSAHDFAMHGGLKGRIHPIRPHALSDTERGAAVDATYY